MPSLKINPRRKVSIWLLDCIGIYHSAQNFYSKLFIKASSVNVTKSTGNCGFGHICYRNAK